MSRLIKLVGNLNTKLGAVDDLRERLERIEKILASGKPKVTASTTRGLPQDVPVDLAEHPSAGLHGEDKLNDPQDNDNDDSNDNHDNNIDEDNRNADGDDSNGNAHDDDNDVDGQDNGEDNEGEGEGDNDDDY